MWQWHTIKGGKNYFTHWVKSCLHACNPCCTKHHEIFLINIYIFCKHIKSPAYNNKICTWRGTQQDSNFQRCPAIKLLLFPSILALTIELDCHAIISCKTGLMFLNASQAVECWLMLFSTCTQHIGSSSLAVRDGHETIIARRIAAASLLHSWNGLLSCAAVASALALNDGHYRCFMHLS